LIKYRVLISKLVILKDIKGIDSFHTIHDILSYIFPERDRL